MTPCFVTILSSLNLLLLHLLTSRKICPVLHREKKTAIILYNYNVVSGNPRRETEPSFMTGSKNCSLEGLSMQL